MCRVRYSSYSWLRVKRTHCVGSGIRSNYYAALFFPFFPLFLLCATRARNSIAPNRRSPTPNRSYHPRKACAVPLASRRHAVHIAVAGVSTSYFADRRNGDSLRKGPSFEFSPLLLPFLKQNLKTFELAARSRMRRAAAWGLCVALLQPEPGSGWLASAPSAAAGLQVKERERARDAGGLAFRTFFSYFFYVKI